MGVMMLAGCGNHNTNAVEKSPGRHRRGPGECGICRYPVPDQSDPAESWNSWYTSRYGITETLYKLDENLKHSLFLQKSCEMKDETTCVITLRDDVTYQNGEPVTAKSIKACWERTMDVNARMNELLFIESMTADGQILTVTTSEPVPAFVNGLSEPLTGIYDVTEPDTIAQQPIGTDLSRQ